MTSDDNKKDKEPVPPGSPDRTPVKDPKETEDKPIKDPARPGKEKERLGAVNQSR